ncbi:MAG: hypothetical protein JWQ27_1571 [Ferruginibacter sp.]|nr:hypothetical protein [Ferruginibacter sp.]
MAAAAIATIAVIYKTRRRNTLMRLEHTADEGYETAHDILYPDKLTRWRTGKLRYGPVLPQ